MWIVEMKLLSMLKSNPGSRFFLFLYYSFFLFNMNYYDINFSLLKWKRNFKYRQAGIIVLELLETRSRIKLLEEERVEQDKEVGETTKLFEHHFFWMKYFVSLVNIMLNQLQFTYSLMDVWLLVLKVKRLKEYISELVLHADAQAMKYQQKVRN